MPSYHGEGACVVWVSGWDETLVFVVSERTDRDLFQSGGRTGMLISLQSVSN